MSRKDALRKCLILAGLTVLVVVMCTVFPNAASDPQAGMELELPERIAGHGTLRREPDEKEKEWLPDDTGILKHSYIPVEALPASGEPLTMEGFLKGVHVTLILSGNDPRSLHKPAVCLDGQGWTITGKKVVPLEVNGHRLEVMDFTMHRSEGAGENVSRREAHYVYWWIGKERSTPHDWSRIIFSDLDNMLKNINNRWGYPSIMVYVDPEDENGDEGARQRAYDWIRKYAPVFHKALAPPLDTASAP